MLNEKQIKPLFSIYDKKAGTFSNPLLSENSLLALRRFQSMVEDERSEVNKWPEDFAFYEVGSMDQNTSEIISIVPPRLIGEALAYHPKSQIQSKGAVPLRTAIDGAQNATRTN